jgi:hypothetical protein
MTKRRSGVKEAVRAVQVEAARTERNAAVGWCGKLLSLLATHKLLLVQVVDHVDGQPALRTQLIHLPSDESIEVKTSLKVDSASSVAQSSAIAKARRSSLLTLLDLPAENP